MLTEVGVGRRRSKRDQLVLPQLRLKGPIYDISSSAGPGYGPVGTFAQSEGMDIAVYSNSRPHDAARKARFPRHLRLSATSIVPTFHRVQISSTVQHRGTYDLHTCCLLPTGCSLAWHSYYCLLKAYIRKLQQMIFPENRSCETNTEGKVRTGDPAVESKYFQTSVRVR